MKAIAIAALLAFCAMSAAAAQDAKSAAPADLPEGAAKPVVAAQCIGCHDLSRIRNANHSAAEWRNVVNMMVAAGARLSPPEKDAVTRYLIEGFPERAKPRAIVIAGPVQVSFREWEVPTPGARPHDPLATPDGALWYTGQMANILGRLDPSTGVIKEYQLKTAASGPHGLVDDKAGHIWFTANFAGYIGELDPASGEVREYQLPETARDPHTLLFDNDGVLWFTVQNANMLGRLDPKSGAIKLVTMATPGARPYGMALSADGRSVFFDLFGSNKIAHVDRASMAITEYPLPDGASRPRRIAVSGDGSVWYSDYARGRLGRLDPQTGKVTEYPSPGGPQSQPYAIAALNGAVWYVETGVQPNVLVRFDPATEKFQTWTIPSGGGVVRNMMPTRDGNLALACSGVNGVALAEIKAGGGGT
jgi:virginiamycin B lyase